MSARKIRICRDDKNPDLVVKDIFQKDSVVKDFLTTASGGKKYKTKYYNLDVVISVGYRVKSKRGVEFRRWASLQDPFLRNKLS